MGQCWAHPILALRACQGVQRAEALGGLWVGGQAGTPVPLIPAPSPRAETTRTALLPSHAHSTTQGDVCQQRGPNSLLL